MAFAKKSSRLIVVAGTTFRWVVSGNDGFLELLVELRDRPGRRLATFFRYHDKAVARPEDGVQILRQQRSISPGVVAVIIRAAISRGWEPAAQGKPVFYVRDAEELTPLRIRAE